jgi:hypothetical protein
VTAAVECHVQKLSSESYVMPSIGTHSATI